MNKLALVSIVFGVFIIAVRGPMIFVPETVLDLFRKIIESNKRIRVFGLFVLPIGLAMIFAAWGSTQPGALAFLVLGCIITAVTLVFLLIFPAAYKAIAEIVLDLDESVFRGIGILGVLLGIGLIYLGVAVYYT